MLQHPYRIATIVGLTMGLLAVLCLGFFGMDQSFIVPPGKCFLEKGSWNIPFWGYSYSFDSQPILKLELQALWLRTAYIIAEHGFWFLSIPTALNCGIVKLMHIGRTSTPIRCLAQSLMLFVGANLYFSVLTLISGLVSALNSHPHCIEEIMYYCLDNLLPAFILVNVSGIVPLFALALYLILLNKHYRISQRLLAWVKSSISKKVQPFL